MDESTMHLESEALSLIEEFKRMVQSDKVGVDLLHGIAHIFYTNIFSMKSCVEVLDSTQPPSQDNQSNPRTIPMASIPTFTSNIMANSTQNVMLTHLSKGSNSNN